MRYSRTELRSCDDLGFRDSVSEVSKTDLSKGWYVVVVVLLCWVKIEVSGV